MDRNAGGVEVSEGEGGVRAIGPKADALIAREPPVGAAIRVFAHADKPGHGSRRRGGGRRLGGLWPGGGRDANGERSDQAGREGRCKKSARKQSHGSTS